MYAPANNGSLLKKAFAAAVAAGLAWNLAGEPEDALSPEKLPKKPPASLSESFSRSVTGMVNTVSHAILLTRPGLPTPEGTAEERARLKRIMTMAREFGGSPELFERAQMGLYSISMKSNAEMAIAFGRTDGKSRIDLKGSLPDVVLAAILVHEVAHVDQYQQNLFRADHGSVADVFLQGRMKESVAYAKGIKAEWFLGKKYPDARPVLDGYRDRLLKKAWDDGLGNDRSSQKIDEAEAAVVKAYFDSKTAMGYDSNYLKTIELQAGLSSTLYSMMSGKTSAMTSESIKADLAKQGIKGGEKMDFDAPRCRALGCGGEQIVEGLRKVGLAEDLMPTVRKWVKDHLFEGADELRKKYPNDNDIPKSSGASAAPAHPAGP